MKNTIGIYRITSPTNKVYIGQSWNIERRKSVYKGLHCKKQNKLYMSLKKYGWQGHNFSIIHELPTDVDQQVLDTYEIFYWELYKDCGVEMMNIREPGRGGKNSEESKLKVSLSKKGKKVSEDMKLLLKKNTTPYIESKKVKVTQYNRMGEIIESFSSIREAGKFLKMDRIDISNCMKRKKGFIKDFTFRYMNDTF